MKRAQAAGLTRSLHPNMKYDSIQPRHTPTVYHFVLNQWVFYDIDLLIFLCLKCFLGTHDIKELMNKKKFNLKSCLEMFELSLRRDQSISNICSRKQLFYFSNAFFWLVRFITVSCPLTKFLEAHNHKFSLLSSSFTLLSSLLSLKTNARL